MQDNKIGFIKNLVTSGQLYLLIYIVDNYETLYK